MPALSADCLTLPQPAIIGNMGGKDGYTATFSVEASLPLSLSNSPVNKMTPFILQGLSRVLNNNIRDIDARRHGVNIQDVEAIGLSFKTEEFSKDICVYGSYEILEFMRSELKSLALSVELGSYVQKEDLSRTPSFCQGTIPEHQGIYFYPTIRSQFHKTYTKIMSLSELKSLSKLEVKVQYDSQDYGQKSEVLKK